MSVIEDFQKRIDEFLKSILTEDLPQRTINSKIVHDSVWGTNKFLPWEIALIDSPIMQRLRRIHQTGLAYLVFPTATHTRFEHSLGVNTLVENLVHHLNTNKKHKFIDDDELYNLRLSALLHDVGHTFFSHLAELVYARIPIFQELLKEISEKYDGLEPKGHEIFSLLTKVSHLFLMHIISIVYVLTLCAICLVINILAFPFSVKQLFASQPPLGAAG